MTFDFNDESGTTMKVGNHKDLLKMRKEQLAEFEKRITSAFSGYDGQMTVIIRLEEDSDGTITGSRQIVVGVGDIEQQMYLIHMLDKTKDEIMECIADAVAKEGSTSGIESILLKTMMKKAAGKNEKGA